MSQVDLYMTVLDLGGIGPVLRWELGSGPGATRTGSTRKVDCPVLRLHFRGAPG